MLFITILMIVICLYQAEIFGRHLFGIFILQRLPMMAFQALGESNVYLYFALCFVATVMLAVSFDRVFYKRKI